MKWLVSAFEPFGGAEINPSFVVMQEMQKRTRQREWFEQVKFCGPVPVIFEKGWAWIQHNLEINPEVEGVLALGVAENRKTIGLECVALNWIDARIPDNEGVTPKIGPIVPGSEVLWSAIPWSKFDCGPMSQRSYSAGTYVCNELMYRSLLWAEQHTKRAGFVHVPNASEAVIEEMMRVLEFVVQL